MMRRNRVTNVKYTYEESDIEEYEEDNPKKRRSPELSSLSEASSGVEWSPPKSLRKKVKRRAKRNGSGKLNPCSTDDDDDSDSSIISSHKSKPKLSKLATIEKQIEENKKKKIYSNDQSSKSLTNSSAKIALYSTQNQKIDSQKKKVVKPSAKIALNSTQNQKIDSQEKKVVKPSNKSIQINKVSESSYSRIGEFLILKSDLNNGKNAPLWKIDGKSLLEKYEPFKMNGKPLHKNAFKFVGWCPSAHPNYYPVKIANIQFNKGEHIVELLEEELQK